MLGRIRELACVVRDASDCAVGYQAAQDVLAGLETFSAEYASHVETGRCTGALGQKVPCEALCPAHVDVPGYIALVAAGDCAGAVARVRKDNPFPTACALVCEHPCEARCRRALVDAPVNIRGIKLYAVDNAAADTVPTPERLPRTGRRVAVVGGGPSGLTCAYFLALMGHDVTVFEERSKLGGMLRYGIPAYRFPRERLDEDIRAILGVGGIEVLLDTAVDGARMARLRRDYDAVYVAAGAHEAKGLGLPNEGAPGVTSAVDLLRAVGDGRYPDFTGKDVVVVGGGNVAMDCARTAVRCGAASVSVVYRRRREDMTALPAEVASAVAEGVELLTLEAPTSIEVGADGAVTALLTQPQIRSAPCAAADPPPKTRPSPRGASRPTRSWWPWAKPSRAAPSRRGALGPVADGSRPTISCEPPAVRRRPRGRRASPPCSWEETAAPAPPPSIRAIAAGKVAARNIDRALGYDHPLDCGVEPPPPRPNDRTPYGRVDVAERPARERRGDFAGVEVSA